MFPFYFHCFKSWIAALIFMAKCGRQLKDAQVHLVLSRIWNKVMFFLSIIIHHAMSFQQLF